MKSAFSSKLGGNRFILFTIGLGGGTSAHLGLMDLTISFRRTYPILIVGCLHLQLRSLILNLAGI